MLMPPTEWIIHHVAHRLATVSKKTDVSTALWKISVCLSHCQNTNQQVCLHEAENRFWANPVSYPRWFFFSGAWKMHAGGWILYSTTQKTKHKRGFCMFELPQSPPNTLFFQPHNDLFCSSTASYLAFLSDLEGKIIIWCGGCSSALLILLCPWLLSLLYNSLKPFFLRMRFALDFCMWEMSPKQPCAFVDPIIEQQ